MGIYDEIRNIITPHASNLNRTIAATGMLLNGRLERIEKAASNLGRPNFGDHWFRINFKKELEKAEPTELFECPMNETLLIQSIVVDGIQEKSPAFILTIGGYTLIASVIKEGVGVETIGGDIALMPGETLVITAREKGKISLSVHAVRIMEPKEPHQDHTGEPGGLLEATNLHEPGRDVISSKDGQWRESPGELVEVGN